MSALFTALYESPKEDVIRQALEWHDQRDQLLKVCEWIVEPDHPVGSNAEYKHLAIEKAVAAIAAAKGEA